MSLRDEASSMPLPAFLVTIDTEGDNLWGKPREITTRNAAYLPRFQRLCERYQLHPTWLTNHEMVESREFVEFGSDVLTRQVGEIGMHLHAWNSPPIIPLTNDDFLNQPYLIDYATDVIHEKVKRHTDALEERFCCKMTSHRAGRWALDYRYIRALVDCRYVVDCSVTPNVSWTKMLGDPNGNGGADYRESIECPHFLDVYSQSSVEKSLLEVPMTIQRDMRSGLVPFVRKSLLSLPSGIARRVANRLFPSVHWLRPNGRNLREMLRLLDLAVDENRPHLEFMIHSSELMPGGSPRFPTERSIDWLYEDLEILFAATESRFAGVSLTDFSYEWIRKNHESES